MAKDPYNINPNNFKITSDLYGDMCHIINNDLAIMLGYLEAIEKGRITADEAGIIIKRLKNTSQYIKNMRFHVVKEILDGKSKDNCNCIQAIRENV